MTPRRTEAGPTDIPLFEDPTVVPEAPAPEPVDLDAVAARVAIAAAMNKPPEDKPLSPAYADIGYRRNDNATLAVDPPRASRPKPVRQRRTSTRPVESRYSDIGSDTADSDPSRRTPTEVSADQEAAVAMPEEAQIARDGFAAAAAARRRARRTGVPFKRQP